jgi:hypothetical protein
MTVEGGVRVVAGIEVSSLRLCAVVVVIREIERNGRRETVCIVRNVVSRAIRRVGSVRRVHKRARKSQPDQVRERYEW